MSSYFCVVSILLVKREVCCAAVRNNALTSILFKLSFVLLLYDGEDQRISHNLVLLDFLNGEKVLSLQLLAM